MITDTLSTLDTLTTQEPSPVDEAFVEAVEALVELYPDKNIPELVSAIEKATIKSHITRAKNLRRAARNLGIGKTTFYRKLKSYGIPNPRKS